VTLHRGQAKHAAAAASMVPVDADCQKANPTLAFGLSETLSQDP